jgi:hypothetical protein
LLRAASIECAGKMRASCQRWQGKEQKGRVRRRSQSGQDCCREELEWRRTGGRDVGFGLGKRGVNAERQWCRRRWVRCLLLGGGATSQGARGASILAQNLTGRRVGRKHCQEPWMFQESIRGHGAEWRRTGGESCV